jgi:TonB-linked SusC/RagA family outer membrane protein
MQRRAEPLGHATGRGIYRPGEEDRMNRAWKLWPVLSALLALPTGVTAQEREITGTVTAEGALQPLGGVQVSVKGTSLGTITDFEGNFSIGVPAGRDTLVFTSIGYRTLELPAAPNMRVVLEQQAIGLEGIVVTALGVQREKSTLGYSVQDVSGAELSEVPELNVVNSLKGNVAGVQITDAGPTGGSSRIVIRGASSIAGNNQPLFIVDGVPVDNRAPDNSGYGGIDYGNAIQDIHPSNIESISVLKGPNAAALYGSRAQNGAIVITTKTGAGGPSEGLGITASTSLTFEEPLRLPNYQNLYGQGLNGEFRFVDGEGGGTWDFVDESWGPRLDGRLIDQFTGPQQPWLPHPDNVGNFLRTGRTLNSNVAVTRAGERSHVRLSVTHTGVEGMAPGNSINRLGIAVRGGADISDDLSAEASINYTNQNGINRPGTGYDEDNPMQQFIWFGRQIDMGALSDYRCTGDEPTSCQPGGQYNWNYNYHNNPFWEQHVNGNDDQRDRLIGHVALDYAVTDWLTATARAGRDWYRDHRKRVIAHFSLDDAGEGSFAEDLLYVSETNVDALVTAQRQLTSDLGLSVTAGGNLRTNNYETQGVAVSRLTVPGIYTIDNAATTPDPYDRVEEREVRGVYGSASFNFRGWLNLDLTGRNDWSSTLPEGNNSYFYPSISSAFVFTDALGLQSDLLSSGKVRASWTRVGNDAAPYQLSSVFTSSQGFGGVPLFGVPNELPNVDLKPEETTAWEVGADIGLLNERLGFVVTYYDSRTRNQILGVQISPASGYTSQVLNAGEVRNYGAELLLMANPVRTEKFNWDVTVNWSKNNSQVRELYGELETLVLGSYWSLDVEARGPRRDENGNIVEYFPYGALFGNPYLRDEQGRLVLTDAGLPQADPVRRVLGNYNPDWIGGIQNRFSYGPVDLSVLVDGQMGGDIFSVTNWFGEDAGVLESSLRGREDDFCDPGIVVPGVLPDGSTNGDGDDDLNVCPQAYFNTNFGIHEASIDDASYIKLREVRLGYTIPSEFMSRFGFSGGSIALIGRNLALWSEIENIDPETAFDASNVQGIEFGQFPTARSIGFSVSIRP